MGAAVSSEIAECRDCCWFAAGAQSLDHAMAHSREHNHRVTIFGALGQGASS